MQSMAHSTQKRTQERNSRNKATRSPEGLALVASWLEETSHLTRPPVEDFLRDDDTLRSLRNVSGFLSAESNPRAGLNGTASSAARSLQEPSLSSPEAAAERAAPPLTNHTNASTPTYRPQPGTGEAELAPRNLPDQLRHRGVETLLTEYYKMVAKAKVESGTVANRHKPSLGDKLMRLLFPAPPRFLEANSLASYLEAGGVMLSRLVVQLIFLVLPLWLYALRHVVSDASGGWVAASVYGILGILFLFLAERIHTQSNAEARNRANNTIAAFHIGSDGKMPAGSHNFLAAVVRCQELVKQLSQNRNPGSVGSSSQSVDHSAAGGSQPISVHVTGDQEYLLLAREIEEVKFAVLGESSTPKEPNGSGVAELRNQIKRLCDAVGLECQTPELRNVPSMMAKLKQIREMVGC